ncbi:phosphocholine cytidylyltransferase family protein [Amycolatopsis acidiphila]|uniref:Phosphocholine cytidylyltransferase family protein n=1 Tax=Amycolatopsis acidiphila TaxID=715473 RepID=A0A557ZPW4_9PSEU|nr:phosphocholine cytidylyltransferase family protein [Amycolatopsis acidiphila]TVT14051.1 phosphocholine cytidylyltransferase family protein [Amycolatopsis acidiphila]UIJ63605.1 phosphocholine cytidylyltransferase family protein [Amycolatopsis acidiphila]GHG67977.1 transferase [Amycolatopsis acidiphila]
MRAVVLAAGCGSRMGERTADRPKCLIEVDGRTLLERQLAALGRASEVAVVTGWQAERFEHRSVRRFHNPDWATSSMLDSLACAGEWLADGPTLVSYGDIVYTTETVAALAAARAPIAIAYDPDWHAQWSRRFEDPLSDAETFAIAADGTVTGIGERPTSLDEVQGQYVGLLKLEPSGWCALRDELAGTGRRDTTGVLARVIRGGATRVQGVAVRGPWHEFDSAHDLAVGLPVLRRVDRALFAGTPS